MLGKDNVERLILLPNAQAGTPFAPLSGYLLRVKNTTPLRGAHVDASTLFKTRCIFPLVNIADEDMTKALASMTSSSLVTAQ